ncbi:hypothetical protein NQ314_015512 [Rhamnusium bicolor]|uniref:EF-hand domain-containing protein n=1 Tax=Rhamnusium bicolor TaxID=1586634 RepID=A0AAV8WZI9_9CUCU|nr:hypothetical protein NQ314_015512 [Rhamnusium bicolor]
MVHGLPKPLAEGYLTIEIFQKNPQYLLSINVPEKNKTYRILIGLMQKNRRIHNLPELPLGFVVYRLINSAQIGERLSQDFLTSRKPIYARHLETTKQITGHIDLSNGNYCIIPFTEDTKSSCDFLLRIYSEVEFNVEEYDEEIGMISNDKNLSITYNTASPDNAIKEVFKNFAGKDEQISWVELKKILDLLLTREKQEFSKEVCRSMVAMMDTDRSGKLNFHEFYELWEKIGKWRGVFRTNDLNLTNTISGPELREALKAANIKVNNRILNMLILRYGNENGELEMEDFLHCCIKLAAMIQLYESGSYRKEKADDWIIDTVYS